MMIFNRTKPIKNIGYYGQKIYRNISIREKFIIFFLFFSLTPILIIGVISINSFKKVVMDKIVRYSLAELGQTAVNLELKMSEYETISLQLFVNKEFNAILENFVDTENSFSNNAMHKSVETCFNEYMNNNKDLLGFMFLSYFDNERSIVVTKDFQKEFAGLKSSFKCTSAFRDIMKADGGIVWSNAIKINQKNYVILGRLIKRLSNGKPLGVLAIIIDEDKMDQLVNLTIYNDLNNSLNGIENYSIIIKQNGEIVSSPFKEDIGKNVSQITRNILSAKYVLRNSFSGKESKIDHGSFITNVNHKESLVTYKAIGSQSEIGGENGWYLVNLTPTSFLYEERQVVAITALILCLVFGILAVWISFYATKII
jgi:hypothetical protein